MKLYYYIFLFISILISAESFSQGLKFISSKEQPIHKRTSYNVLGDKPNAFSENFTIDFDMAFYPETRIGYLLRIKNSENDKIYNLFYDGQGSNIIFKFNEEGKSSLLTAELNREELVDLRWFKLRLFFDLENNSIQLIIDKHIYFAKNVGLSARYSPIVIFGKSDYIIDVPSFAIRNITVGNNHLKYSFPLRENEGGIVHDVKGRNIGKVVNPEWLINDSYHWKLKVSATSNSVAGANYNPGKEEIYYFNRDSIFIYSVRSGQKRTEVFKEDCPVKLNLGTNFIDSSQNRLYTYELQYSEHYNGPTISSLDLNTYKWSIESFEKLPSHLHHHGSYFDANNHRYIIFGGFGRMHYNKIFYAFDTENRSWDTLRFEGDTIRPRYFQSMGYQKSANSLYIFGGMGNSSGEQVVGRKYFYDLFKVDLTTGRVSKLWEIPWTNDNVVPVRGMIIRDSSFYTLCYPEYFSNSFLRLYRFSLKDGSFEILGDSIPIHSDRITTNANLYFDDQLNTLYATVQEFDDDIVSDLKIYSLSFPPITAKELMEYLPGQKANYLWVVIVFFFVASAIVFIVIRKRRRLEKPEIIEISGEDSSLKKLHKTDMPNSIYLFGEFTVRDRQNRDISYMFSSKLKQAFLLIFQYSEEGITSQHLSHLLWPDKPEDKVKNSRGVTINNLRKIVKELDGIELVFEKGVFKIVMANNCYCDYTRCLQIVASGLTEENKEELLGILNRGKFLQAYDLSLFDLFKGTLEQELEPVLLAEMKRSLIENEYSVALRFAEAMLKIDPLSDEALTYQVRALQRMKQNYEAQKRYMEFVKEYKKMMGDDYPRAFNDLK